MDPQGWQIVAQVVDSKSIAFFAGVLATKFAGDYIPATLVERNERLERIIEHLDGCLSKMTPEQVEALESIKPGIIVDTQNAISSGHDVLQDLFPEIQTVQGWFQRYNVFNSICKEFLIVEKEILKQNKDFAATTRTYRQRLKQNSSANSLPNGAPAVSAAMMYDLTRVLHNAVAFTIETLRPTIAQAALRDRQLQAPEANSYPIIGIA